MKLARLEHGGQKLYGSLNDERFELLEGDPFEGIRLSGMSVGPNEVEILAPTVPSKIVAAGLNYRDHAIELGMNIPHEPVLFLKPPSAVIGPDRLIIYPPLSQRVEFEAELAVIIKKKTARISREQAPDHILGYTCANDVTARDLQKRDGQWTRAKSFDTFCPLGPYIATELDPARLEIKLWQNGVIKQASSTHQMIFDVFELIAYISDAMTLLPGDVVLTGTPPGVGPVSVGDSLAIEIQGIGRLENKII
jgi:2-keto-4-pentenoate hydratase/2-oxohepta-3-ene-1,7-dioic acid hydratase in catechol pathway